MNHNSHLPQQDPNKKTKTSHVFHKFNQSLLKKWIRTNQNQQETNENMSNDDSNRLLNQNEKNKVDLVYRLASNTYIILSIAVIIGFMVSNYSLSTRLFFIMIMITASITSLILLFISNRLLKTTKQKHLMILLTSLGYSGIYSIITADKGVITITPLFAIFLFLVFFSFDISFIMIYLAFFILTIILYFISMGSYTVDIGNGMYFARLIMVGLLGYGILVGVRLFRGIEAQLYLELENAYGQNSELSSLNEEYAAAEEELFSQYDKISHLNKNSQYLVEQLDAIVSATEDGIIEFDSTSNTFTPSLKAVALLGTKDIHMTDTNSHFMRAMSSTDQEAFINGWQQVLSGELNEIILNLTYKKEDRMAYFRFTILSYISHYEQKTRVVIVVKDMTTEKRQERQLYRIAYYDELTDLTNKNGFISSLAQMLNNESDMFYVVLVDLDDFKYINDTFGYETGDKVLVQVANELKKLSVNWHHLSRLGGDEFGFVIKSFDGAASVLNLINSAKLTFEHQEIHIGINFSVGVVEVNISNEIISAFDVVKNAEIAMYQAKEIGKNSIVYYDEKLSEMVQKRLVLSNAMDSGLAKGEMFLVFQPKIRSLDNQLMGFEALIRWHSSEFGWVSPYELIKLSEQSGFIIDLGEWIIREAALFSKKCNDEIAKYRISINISGKQLIQPEFFNRFMAILNDVGVDYNTIGVEVTETAVIGNLESASKVLGAIKAQGIKIYLDDFGTGYSSLNYLSRLPIDLLKIDKSFIDTIHLHEKDKQLVGSIIQLAKNLNIETLAEGVEIKEQLAILKVLDCQYIQGYYFDKPLSVEEAMKKVANEK